MTTHQVIADLAAAVAAMAMGILLLRFLVVEIGGHVIIAAIRRRRR